MDEITLKRGNETVTFRKDDRNFAIRLRQGRAADERALEAACHEPRSSVRHVKTVPTERMDVFAVENPATLEETMDDLREAPASDVVTHLYTVDDSGSPMVPTGTMTIQFASAVSAEEREATFEEFGLEVIEELYFLDHGYTVRLTDASTENPLKIAATLQGREGIETAEPDFNFEIVLLYRPTDPLYSLQWHLNNEGGSPGLRAGADVDAETAWEYTRGNRDVTVCVMDDGFDLGHPDFDTPGKVVAPRDFAGGDFDPTWEHRILPDGTVYDEYHGTACAGVAVAEENGSGVVGLAPGCALMPIRLGSIGDEDLRRLFQYAIDEGADVISCSWRARPWYAPLSTKVDGIIRTAATEGRDGRGCVILFAAGNEDRPLDGEKDGQSSHLGFALHPNVIAVGASNSRDERSWYSNFGPELTLCAPSSGSPGVSITTTDHRGSPGRLSGDYNNIFGGTSSATPLAAGLAALVLSVRPELSATEVRQVLTETAEKIDAEGGEYDANGHSPWYGYGRINAGQALAMAVGDGDERLPQVLAMEHRIDRPIPDQGTVTDTIPFPLDVTPRDVEVSVEIRHTWRGDLHVTLTTPTGVEVVLADGSGGSADDFVRTFRASDDPTRFSDVLSGSAAGDWRLTVEDMLAQDVGTVAQWGLAVTYSPTE